VPGTSEFVERINVVREKSQVSFHQVFKGGSRILFVFILSLVPSV
jgi:hypothetical protein